MNTFLYLFGMTLAFYGLKYLLGFFVPQFDDGGVFQARLFWIYTGLSLLCGLGCAVLYFWNKARWYSSVLYALPVSTLLAEGIACGIVLFSKHMLLGQTIFDLAAAAWFSIALGKKAPNKLVFLCALAAFSAIVFRVVYLNWITF